MKQYTIYCTIDQTMKALELGAPIDKTSPWDKAIPTAEQMIGWLESNGISDIRIMLYKGRAEYTWDFTVYPEGALENRQLELIKEMDGFESRKEAILAAIDYALEYLITKKKG